MQKVKFFVVIIMILAVTLNATIYEDGSKNVDKRWINFDNTPDAGSIRIVDENNNSYVEFNLTGVSNGYMLGDYEKNNKNAWKNKSEKILRWDMKYSKSFIINISIETPQGHRYISYSDSNVSNGKQGKFIHFGLGKESKSGTWKTFERNLDADLKSYEGNNSIEEVNAFMVRGSGKIDNIELVK